MHPDHPPQTFGADLRALRRTRGMTLQQLADGLGRSVGWLSQVERDLSVPSVSDLRQLASALDVSVDMLERHAPACPEEAGRIVRKDARRPFGARVPGLVEELLSPDMTDDFEVVMSTFEAGSEVGTPVSRPTQELGCLLTGRLDLTIDGARFTLTAGDSFRIRGEPFRWANPYSEPATAIWVIAPPVY
jgi:transcriptional regulator with XRE-family HTH domain